VLVKKEDLEKIKNTFVSKLKDKVKAGVEFRPSQNINAGFSISFDKGRSYFDFSDEGLLEALSAYLNPELAKLIK
jgi:vacuolar-type H+-ATPase subunit E/Vma4